ncbi:hypothetical protein [Lysinibacillus antri]|uniref:Uracil-DNA glycosylase-like domain-containing protein n=1 Tax=Lysinibacillus antri TaxID=2498145 RepID=A0A432L9N6_9BACI|nr:hypothetical protein [Lysinibacillus antri]RUL50322.1 hypothetical protein EK386_14180 [Lysinibacillus antri]
MTVSTGFFKKIQQWIVDENSGEIAYQPFQVNGNPYKSNVFLLGAIPEPYLQITIEDLKLYADALVNTEVFQEFFHENTSREYKGCLNFMAWMKGQLQETVVYTNVNCLYMESTKKYNELKKQKDPSFIKGSEIFQEVLNEFTPKVLIVQGTTAWKYFLEEYEDQLIDYNGKGYSAQQLETNGVVGRLPLANGENVNILVCRSMSYFGKTGTSFGDFKQTLDELLS